MGRVAGHRGTSGELTVRTFGGLAEPWQALKEVWIRLGATADRRFAVEQARSYRDRLVLKLQGIDDPSAANALRGGEVLALLHQAPSLPPGQYWIARLIGLQVIDEDGEVLGRVAGVLPTGGTDVLIVAAGEPGDGSPAAAELLVPLAPGIVSEVSEQQGTIRVNLPDGLLELNRPEAGAGEQET
jgi:16S rRNA processing protein RimM